MKILDLFSKEIDHSNIFRPYFIAEAGVNHEGDLEIAKQLIYEAAEGGANAIKFQTYKAETIASKDSPSYWDTSKEPTKSQYQLFKKYDKFWKKDFEQLKIWCDQADIEFMSTPFDIESANFLNEMMDIYKISSSDITNKPFIEFIANFKKPIILSTGASSMQEIRNAVAWIDKKNNPLALLHCILNYPTRDINANLGMIRDLQAAFPNNLIGYSDHTLPKDMKVSELAMMLGCSIIEKHFTHDKSLPGNDHYHAMDKNDLKAFNKTVDYIFTLLGDTKKQPLEDEQLSRDNARRSLVSKCAIKNGQEISADLLTWKRPASGICPSRIEELIGMTASEDIPEDSILTWKMFKSK